LLLLLRQSLEPFFRRRTTRIQDIKILLPSAPVGECEEQRRSDERPPDMPTAEGHDEKAEYAQKRFEDSLDDAIPVKLATIIDRLIMSLNEHVYTFSLA